MQVTPCSASLRAGCATCALEGKLCLNVPVDVLGREAGGHPSLVIAARVSERGGRQERCVLHRQRAPGALPPSLLGFIPILGGEMVSAC